MRAGCPTEATQADTEPGLERWLTLKADYSKKWPNIARKGEAPADAKEFEGVPDEFEKYFSDKPAKGS